MEVKLAHIILGDRATWELKAMEKALSILPFLNTKEEDERLEAVKVMLKSRRKQ